jgi:ribosome-associated translation inhibitor RaiA
MNLKIYSSNFEKSEFLYDHIEDQLNQSLHSGLSHEVMSVRIWLKIDNSFLKRGKDQYRCEIKLHTKSHGVLFSKEVTHNCYESAKIAIQEVAAMLNKRIECGLSKDRKRVSLYRSFFKVKQYT